MQKFFNSHVKAPTDPRILHGSFKGPDSTWHWDTVVQQAVLFGLKILQGKSAAIGMVLQWFVAETDWDVQTKQGTWFMLGASYDVLPSFETCPLCSSAPLLWHTLSANKTSLSKEPHATRPAAAIERECLEINCFKTGFYLWGSWNAGTLFSPLSALGQIRQRTTYGPPDDPAEFLEL